MKHLNRFKTFENVRINDWGVLLDVFQSDIFDEWNIHKIKDEIFDGNENDPDYNAAVFIKRVDNDSAGISGFVCIESSDKVFNYVEFEDGNIKTQYHNFTTTSDFMHIIPFKFEKGRKYSVEFQLDIPENTIHKKLLIDDFEKIKSNGCITK